MMEQGVSNLHKSEFHSSCSWEKYIIHSSLTIKWSSAFSFLPVVCTSEKSWVFFPFFFLFLVLLALVSSANTVGHRAEHSHSPDGARDVGDTLSPHHPIWAWEIETLGMNLQFLQGLMAFQQADNKHRGCRKQDKERLCHHKQSWNLKFLWCTLSCPV